MNVAISGSCTVFFVTPSGDGPAVLQSCSNAKVPRGKRNIELISAYKIDLSVESARNAAREMTGRSYEEVIDYN